MHIGDLFDWASLSFHEKSPGLSDATHEFELARRRVATLARAFPKVDCLIGNHDALTERQAVAVGLPPQILRDYADLWDVAWTIHPRFSKVVVDGVSHPDGHHRGAASGAELLEKGAFPGAVVFAAQR